MILGDCDSGVVILNAEGTRFETMCDVMRIRIERRVSQVYVDQQSSAKHALHGCERMQ